MSEGYIDPIYGELEKSLNSIIEDYDIDRVSIRSLIRSCVEIQETDPPHATVSVISRDCSNGRSVRVKNIKVNLSFALNTIFFCKTIYDSDGIWLVLGILNMVVALCKEMSVKLDSADARIVYCLYLLRNAELSKIQKYTNGRIIKDAGDAISLEEAENSLRKLEKIGTVIMENGEYRLADTILFTK